MANLIAQASAWKSDVLIYRYKANDLAEAKKECWFWSTPAGNMVGSYKWNAIRARVRIGGQWNKRLHTTENREMSLTIRALETERVNYQVFKKQEHAVQFQRYYY